MALISVCTEAKRLLVVAYACWVATCSKAALASRGVQLLLFRGRERGHLSCGQYRVRVDLRLDRRVQRRRDLRPRGWQVIAVDVSGDFASAKPRDRPVFLLCLVQLTLSRLQRLLHLLDFLYELPDRTDVDDGELRPRLRAQRGC